MVRGLGRRIRISLDSSSATNPSQSERTSELDLDLSRGGHTATTLHKTLTLWGPWPAADSERWHHRSLTSYSSILVICINQHNNLYDGDDNYPQWSNSHHSLTLTPQTNTYKNNNIMCIMTTVARCGDDNGFQMMIVAFSTNCGSPLLRDVIAASGQQAAA